TRLIVRSYGEFASGAWSTYDQDMVRACAVVALLAGVAAAAPKKAAPKAAPAPAAPKEADAPDEPAAPAPGNAHSEGEYGGVVPGQPRKTEANKKPKRPPPKGTLAWVGFAAKSGASEVFFQSIAPFELAQHVDKGVLVVNLTGLTRLGQNTWRPIDTRFFETRVARVAARRA